MIDQPAFRIAPVIFALALHACHQSETRVDVNGDIATIHDRRASEGAFLEAVSRIPAGRVPSTFWSDIANDRSYRTFRSDVAVFELFRRHQARPSTLGQTAALLAGGGWLADAVIEKIVNLGGEIPVVVPDGGVAFIIRLANDQQAPHHDMVIYIALDHDMDAVPLRDALMGRSAEPSTNGIMITDFALYPETIVQLRAP
ncbi:MAG TPA: hypothetical protein VHI13_09080 [Candidatus Kapabacteria bacterium]|nr:hypothetical protein [Candidatus Kapabacteria bacterium]